MATLQQLANYLKLMAFQLIIFADGKKVVIES
jgi:hypothetical protein